MPTPAEAAAEKSQLELDGQRLFVEFSEGALAVDCGSLAILAANPVSEEITGYCVSEVVGQSLEILFPPGEATRHAEIAPASLIQQPGLHDEVLLQRKDGSLFSGAVHVTLLQDRGTPLAVLFIRDTSARRKLERELITKHLALKEAYEQLDQRNTELGKANQQLDQGNTELAQANQKLDQRNAELARANEEIRRAQQSVAQLEKMATIGRFASGVAHEINNPMTFILENLQRLHDYSAHILPVLRSHLDAPGPHAASTATLQEVVVEFQTILDETLEGGNRVSSIVRQLHSFSNTRDQSPEWVDLREIIESAITMVRNQVRQRARLERHYYDIPRVTCIPGQIGQVLVNVLVNAVHAIREGDADRNWILVRTQSLGDRVVLEIKDTGCGIPAENVPRVMEPFFTTKPAGVGTGLGLAISATIVEQHGGSIDVESKVGEGTTVRITLPVQGMLPAPSAAPATVASSPTGRLTILLVDDEVFLLRALKRNLGKDHDVLLASGALQALEVLAQTRVDAVLVDLMMPDMDGVDFYRRVALDHPELKDRVVFMTGGVFTERARTFLAQVNLMVLSKPIRRDDLRTAIASLGRLSVPPSK